MLLQTLYGVAVFTLSPYRGCRYTLVVTLLPRSSTITHMRSRRNSVKNALGVKDNNYKMMYCVHYIGGSTTLRLQVPCIHVDMGVRVPVKHISKLCRNAYVSCIHISALHAPCACVMSSVHGMCVLCPYTACTRIVYSMSVSPEPTEERTCSIFCRKAGSSFNSSAR